MAKLFKISAYIIDANDEFCTEDRLADCLVYDTQNHFSLDHLKIQSTDLGEWYDEHPLNYIDCSETEYEKYFKEN